MAARSNFTVFFLLLTVAASLRSSAAATFDVGDALGWTMPPNPSTYSDWASTKTFVVGDILVFNFTTGRHDVTKVTKDALDSCSGNNPISVVSSSPARVTLATAGNHHFICSFPGHCDAGQKLSVTVRAQSSPSPRASPPSSTPAPSPSQKPSTPGSPSLPPSPRSGQPPKASPPTATPPPETPASPPTDTAPSTPSPTTTPPPPNSANSLGGFSLFSTVLAIAIALIY